jgi:UDP-N-acetylmuramate dehydrogenase
MNGIQRLQQALVERGYGPRLRLNEPLARHTSFAIGGPADLLLVAQTLEELQEWVQLAWELAVPVVVLGEGTNVLVADAGVRGLVVLNACTHFGLEDDGLVVAQSGVLLRRLARWAVEQGWEGLEWAVGVPGTVGGAVVGNAGAYGGSMADNLAWVTLLRPKGKVEKVPVEALAYGYRTSALKQETGRRSVVLEAALQLKPGDPAELARRAEQFTVQRRERTPAGCCAGSVFKRTLQYPAGFLIEQAGLKGRRLGGAEISPQHANFIMNTGGASAAEVRALIRIIQDKVWATFGQHLEPEIEFIGDWSQTLHSGTGEDKREHDTT